MRTVFGLGKPFLSELTNNERGATMRSLMHYHTIMCTSRAPPLEAFNTFDAGWVAALLRPVRPPPGEVAALRASGAAPNAPPQVASDAASHGRALQPAPKGGAHMDSSPLPPAGSSKQ